MSQWLLNFNLFDVADLSLSFLLWQIYDIWLVTYVYAIDWVKSGGKEANFDWHWMLAVLLIGFIGHLYIAPNLRWLSVICPCSYIVLAQKKRICWKDLFAQLVCGCILQEIIMSSCFEPKRKTTAGDRLHTRQICRRFSDTNTLLPMWFLVVRMCATSLQIVQTIEEFKLTWLCSLCHPTFFHQGTLEGES